MKNLKKAKKKIISTFNERNTLELFLIFKLDDFSKIKKFRQISWNIKEYSFGRRGTMTTEERGLEKKEKWGNIKD
jgi:hypothetical protein